MLFMQGWTTVAAQYMIHLWLAYLPASGKDFATFFIIPQHFYCENSHFCNIPKENNIWRKVSLQFYGKNKMFAFRLFRADSKNHNGHINNIVVNHIENHLVRLGRGHFISVLMSHTNAAMFISCTSVTGYVIIQIW